VHRSDAQWSHLRAQPKREFTLADHFGLTVAKRNQEKYIAMKPMFDNVFG
jgi:hypothetical protein